MKTSKRQLSFYKEAFVLRHTLLDGKIMFEDGVENI